MGQWLKLWWHCLWLTTFRPGEDHRMCSLSGEDRTKHFCSCGYLNEGKTWDDEIRDAVERD